MRKIALLLAVALAAVFVSGFSSCNVRVNVEPLPDYPPGKPYPRYPNYPYHISEAQLYEHNTYFDWSSRDVTLHIRYRGESRRVNVCVENIYLNVRPGHNDCQLIDAEMIDYSRARHVTIHVYSLSECNRWQRQLERWRRH